MKKFVILLSIIIIFAGLINYTNREIDAMYEINKNIIEQIKENIPNYVTIDKIPKDYINAVLAVEDNRFYWHLGFDPIAITRSFIANKKAKRVVQGGSTITQQLCKNLFLSNNRSYNRKLKELILSLEMEVLYSKDQILEMYINVIYYGAGAYGLGDAAKVFYNKEVDELTLNECAMLAGLPQAPSAYNPKKYMAKAIRRQNIVLSRMKKCGYIKSNEGTQAFNPKFTY